MISNSSHQHSMTRVGHKKHHRKHAVKDVEAVVSLDDVSVKDVEEEVYDSDDEDKREKPEDWEDDDARWGNPPTVGKPTIVNAKILVGQLQDLDTVRGTLGIR